MFQQTVVEDYVDLYNLYSLKGQFNIRLSNASNPTHGPYYDIETNATKLNYLKNLIDDGFGVTSHTEPWENLTEIMNVSVRFSGDVTGDGFVDIYDLYRISKAYEATPDSPNWDGPCDFSGPSDLPDGVINIFDLDTVVENYGKTS